MKICGREVPEVSFPFIDRFWQGSTGIEASLIDEVGIRESEFPPTNHWRSRVKNRKVELGTLPV